MMTKDRMEMNRKDATVRRVARVRASRWSSHRAHLEEGVRSRPGMRAFPVTRMLSDEPDAFVARHPQNEGE